MRIMLWNIQDLSFKKLMVSVADPAQLRQQHITENIATVNPDILVVLEVETAGITGPGSVVALTSGGPAVVALLYHLRSVDPGGQWCLVPPLILGNTATGNKEAIAVYFKNSVVDFAGPFQLGRPVRNPAGFAGESLGGHALTYPPPWDTALPAVPPVGPQVGNNLNQNQLAGRWQWAIGFPDAEHRQPFQTIFREKGGAIRTINLFSMHAPAKPKKAVDALKSLAQLVEINSQPSAKEIRVIAGDFNVNRLNPNYSNGYDALLNLRYTLSVAYTPNHQTTLGRASIRGRAPYFGYMSQGKPGGTFPLPDPDQPRKLLCNFLVRPGSAPGYVVNRVVGTTLPTPLNNIPSAMGQSIETIKSTVVGQVAQDTALQLINNLGKVRGASDHMAMFIDI